jgi:hypothetical protein
MEYEGEFNLDLLHEELEALEGAVSFDEDGFKVAHYTVGITETGLEIKGLDDEVVADVVSKHDKDKKSKAEKDKEAQDAKKQAVLDQLGITKEQLEDLLSG